VIGLLRAVLRAKSRRNADPRLVGFARGLAIGALVGAAIAGSTIWSRRILGAPTAEEADRN
jgi:hypothetical protein